MKPLLLAALLLAAPAAAQTFSLDTGPYDLSTLTSRGIGDTLELRGVVPIPARPPITADDVIPVINGSAVWPGSVECKPFGTALYVPTRSRAKYIRDTTRRFIEMDLDTGALVTPVPYAVWRALIKLDWEQQFFDRPLYSQYAVPPGYTANCPPYWCGCAAGVGTLMPKISVSDPSRVEALLSWEVVNATLGLLQLPGKWDGPYVANVVNRVSAEIGGWKTQ